MIVKLEGIKNQQVPDWSKIFDESLKYKMLYILSIIEYLMEDEDEDQLPEKQEAQQVLSTELWERKKNNSSILENFVIKKNIFFPEKMKEKHSLFGINISLF